MRYLADGSATYRAFAQRQADALVGGRPDPLNQIGQRWTGTTPNVTDWRTQASALEALTATPNPAGG